MDATYVGEVDYGCYLRGRGRLWMLLTWVRSIMDATYVGGRLWSWVIMDATYVGEVDYGCYLRGSIMDATYVGDVDYGCYLRG